MASILNSLNLSISISSFSLCFLGIILLLVSAKPNHRIFVHFLYFYIVLFLFSGSNFIGQILRGRPGSLVRVVLLVSNFNEFLAPFFLCHIISLYFYGIIDPQKKKSWLYINLYVMMFIHVSLLIISQFTGLYYSINEQNVYSRARFYFVSYLPTLYILIINVSLLFKHADQLTHKEKIAFGIYYIIPVAAALAQIFIYGIYIILFSTVISAITMYIFIISDATEQYYEKEKEIAHLKLKITLSQIRPHFIYNTLASIYVLCQDNPKRAMKVIESFIHYLRGNFSGFSAAQPIPFLDELSHTKAYLSVEQMRYEDLLTISYDLDDNIFNLPALTLQPIVENSVKHGIKDSEPLEIQIRTFKKDNMHILQVEDNGIGFDPSVLKTNEYGGLQNVEERLRYMSSGTLTIDSTPGKGTLVTISIPDN
ncbi:MAG: histidine kinase [Clostridia bacterium]|nr:histidine kinase [Clostridia bacterium]